MAYTNGHDFEYTLVKEIATLGMTAKFSNELNIVAWNGYPAKYDIRRYKVRSDGSQSPTKGIALTCEEMKNLKAALNEIDDFEEYLEEHTRG